MCVCVGATVVLYQMFFSCVSERVLGAQVSAANERFLGAQVRASPPLEREVFESLAFH